MCMEQMQQDLIRFGASIVQWVQGQDGDERETGGEGGGLVEKVTL